MRHSPRRYLTLFTEVPCRLVAANLNLGSNWLRHSELGSIELEYSGFSIDGRPNLSMIVYNPVDAAVAEWIRLTLT